MTTTTTALVGVVWEVWPQRQRRQSEGMTLPVERGTPRARGDWHLLRLTLRRRLGHGDHAGCMGGSRFRSRGSVVIHLQP